MLPTIVDYHHKFQRLPEELVLSGAALAVLYSPQAPPGFQPDDDSESLRAIARAWEEGDSVEKAVPAVCATMLEILCPGIDGRLADKIPGLWREGMHRYLDAFATTPR